MDNLSQTRLETNFTKVGLGSDLNKLTRKPELRLASLITSEIIFDYKTCNDYTARNNDLFLYF